MLRAVAVIALVLAAFIAPSLFVPPKPVLTTARITKIVAVPGEPARVLIVRGTTGQIGGATIRATRLHCAVGERVRALIRDGHLLPDPSRCLRQTRARSSR
ncbi:hypothetical protein SPHINGO361_70102 [Sphingomonas sp. EC-HK361]|nr:hypothetical protein SPHINGO361_70102 [Sphingomonas sp. EC-HK361]